MTVAFDRRDFIRGGSVAAGAAILAVAAPRASAQTASTTPLSYTPKPLPFDPQKIPGLSEKILVSHYENNYKGAVNRINQINEQLAGLDLAKTPGFVIGSLKREQLITTNSVIIHELYFAGLGEESRPGPALAAALARDFGSIEHWQADFAATGKALAGGSGWVLLTYSPHDKRLVNQWAGDHSMTLAGGQPILALDMYEHAYHMDFGAKAGAYIDAFMKAIRWENADKLYEIHSRA